MPTTRVQEAATRSVRSRPPVEPIVSQHADDAAVLRSIRTRLVRCGHTKLHHLQRLDKRLAAHLDGLAMAGDVGWAICEAALEARRPGEMFSAGVCALQGRRRGALERLIALAGALPHLQPALASALGWVSDDDQRIVLASLLTGADTVRRRIGVAAAVMRRVDMGAALDDAIRSLDPGGRAAALRAAGQLGRCDLQRAVGDALRDPAPDCHTWAAWAGVMLGDRARAPRELARAAATPGPYQATAFRTLLLTLPLSEAHALLREWPSDGQRLQWLVYGSGRAGDVEYVPWLIGHMSIDQTARRAGESFSLITGVDLALLDLERKPPENFESGPNDDPDDSNVDMDPDDGLPWPDPERVQHWWDANKSRFTPGQRYFMGAPVTRAHCIDVLKTGYQRQRILAAHYLCLLEPGTPLFNTSAPAWRQQRLLADMR
jgi:uncharacterized protein (TIGR02270 family)